ncbi:MAG: Crp/Fnr family transcriptional regulator [Bacteroidetes bacterium]|nr:Crp/Fnr family transcriptional regulator [Bacteroidota bacterium]
MLQEELFNSVLKEEVYKYGEIRSFPSETVILNPHSYIKVIPIVLSGSIKVMETDEETQEILLYYIKPGESCIMSFLAGIRNETSKVKAVIEEDAEVLLVPVEKASVWTRQFPEWADYIFSLYQKRFEELLEVVNAVAFRKLDARLLHLLKQKSTLFKSDTIPVTHQQLADELATQREVVSRLLKQMEKEGIVSLSRNKISLL